MRSMKRVLVLAFAAMALVAVTQASMACPSCYGAPDSSMTEGMNMAILSLLGITGGVLAGFVAFFVYLRKRARMLHQGFADILN